MTKTCSKCGSHKPVSAFARRGKGLHAKCRDCHSAYYKTWYARNRQSEIERAKRTNKEIIKELRELVDKAKDVPCADCGLRFHPCGMDFDHVDPTTKVADVAHLVHRAARKKLLTEMSKCEVVCAVCHRIRTHNRTKHSAYKA